jgi:biotin carboxyl carrier protein
MKRRITIDDRISEVEGRIHRVTVNTGASVQAGQALVEFE